MSKQAIVTMEGNDLHRFIEKMRILIGMYDARKGPDRVEAMIQKDGLKFKGDYGHWTPGIGETRVEG